MGLDTVELAMAIEEEFGVEFPDAVWETMTTPGEIYELLKKTLKTVPAEVCLSQRVFYQLRRALCENYSLPRKDLTPDSKVSDFLTVAEVEEGWPYLQMFIDLETPRFAVANECLGFRLSNKTLRLRDLVSALISLNKDKLIPDVNSEDAIWERLVNCFVNQLNVNRAEVVPNASITRDLGAD